MDKAFQNLIRQWLKDYSAKPESESDGAWLAKRLKGDLTELSEAEALGFASAAVAALRTYNEKRESLRLSEKRGMSRESWLARELKNSAPNMGVTEYGEYLSGLDKAIDQANEGLARVVFTQSGEINQKPDLFGYLAEAELAGTSNLEEAKQRKVQEKGEIPPQPWNEHTTMALASKLAKKAAFAGLQGSAIGAGITVIEKYLEDGEAAGEVVAENLLKAGARSAAACAATGALKVFVEKSNSGIIPRPPDFPKIPGNPVDLGMITSLALDAAATAYEVATGDKTVEEGLLEMERSVTSAVAGAVEAIGAKVVEAGAKAGAVVGAKVGAVIGTVFGPAGSAVGAYIGGSLGSLAGSRLAQTVCSGFREISKSAVSAAQKTLDYAKAKVEEGVDWVKEKARSAWGWVTSWF